MIDEELFNLAMEAWAKSEVVFAMRCGGVVLREFDPSSWMAANVVAGDTLFRAKRIRIRNMEAIVYVEADL